MFCPKCGTTQGDDLKFCKSCGANLFAVRQAVTAPESLTKTGWGKSFVENVMLIQDEHAKRKRDPLHLEEKRANEIKAGVITSCVGLGLMIFLYIFMQGIILGGNIPFGAAQILSRIWIAGVIPLFVGAGLLINGMFVSKKLVELKNQRLQEKDTAKGLVSVRDGNDEFSPDWYESDSAKPSVTENTTRQLENSKRVE